MLGQVVKTWRHGDHWFERWRYYLESVEARGLGIGLHQQIVSRDLITVRSLKTLVGFIRTCTLHKYHAWVSNDLLKRNWDTIAVRFCKVPLDIF